MRPDDYAFCPLYDPRTLADRTRQNKRWGTADGRTLRIGDMTNDHIVNCIFWVRQRPEVYSKDILQMFLDEANYRKLSWYIPEDFAVKQSIIKKINERMKFVRLEDRSIVELKKILEKVSTL